MTRELPTTTERDVFITRAFDAPRDVVWKFWTQPELITQWFGPTAFSVPLDTVEIDLRVGGVWNLAMADDVTGERFPIQGIITACDEPEYLEITLSAQTGVGDVDNVVLRIQFHDHGDKTRITLHQGPFDEVQRDLTVQGWELSFVKLDTVLDQNEEHDA
ncbi:MAG: hypothetical protein JWR53_1989 [Glaciihabitans sp.]|jgi:uncharacterized protein YndB with AHSA1/START domain|nr:hypothetical protein [Glaciihabitans sp.]MDQ1556362.1 hypothetical protein [Actinomycetota bacterium]